MTETFFGCSYSDIWVSPSDWKTTTSKASLKKNWYVQCYFYDPLFKEDYPKGKEYRRKLNRFKTIEERRAAAKRYIEAIKKKFNAGYNPITQKFMLIEPEPTPAKLSPLTPSVEAIEDIWNKILEAAIKALPEADKNTEKPFNDVRVAKNRFVKGLKELRYDNIPIKDLSITQIKETIVHLNITEGYYNKFLSYMSKIFTELIEYGCVENNYFKLYKKARPLKKIREVLTDEEFEQVMQYLQVNHYGLYRYGMIFHVSGARTTELFRLKVKDVDLENQEYKVLIKKGNQYFEEIKVIMLEAMPFWRELLSEAKSEEDYLFSKWLKPGEKRIAARQISRKYNKYIKTRFSEEKGIEITADFYALKHKFLDRLDAMRNEIVLPNAAQVLASHKSDKITSSVYLVNKKKREREILKTLKLDESA